MITRFVRNLILVFVLGIGSAHAYVPTPFVTTAYDRADIVFRATATKVENGRVIFDVSHVWKGQIPKTFSMAARPDVSVDGAFIGHDMIIYANKRQDGEYEIRACNGSRYAEGAKLAMFILSVISVFQ